jgi:hypothetical protein
MSTQKVLRQEDTSFVHVKRGQKEYDQCKAIFEHEKYIFTQAIKKYLSSIKLWWMNMIVQM